LPDDQAAPGAAAHARGLYRAAAQLGKNAAASGNLRAAYYLSHSPPCLRGDARPASWVAAHASLDDPYGVARLLDSLREAGAREQAAALAGRAAAHVSHDHPYRVAWLLDSLRRAGGRPCSRSSSSGVAVRISSISGGRPMAARARDGAGKTRTYDLSRQPGFRLRRGGLIKSRLAARQAASSRRPGGLRTTALDPGARWSS
jgi:hypothetical protein